MAISIRANKYAQSGQFPNVEALFEKLLQDFPREQRIVFSFFSSMDTKLGLDAICKESFASKSAGG